MYYLKFALEVSIVESDKLEEEKNKILVYEIDKIAKKSI